LNIDGRPGMGQVLRPLQRDEFAGTANTRVRFSRDAAGRVVSYGISLPRARDVRFTRLGDATDPPLPQAPAAAGPAVDPGPETASAAPGALVGFYQAAPGHGITITLEGGTLYGEPKGQPKAQLVPMSGTSYSVGREGAAMTATFTLGVDGRATALVLRREDGTERTFPRAP
ncbi:MAG: DUF3471 domain-containing protein, partial [Gemmatimonadetes bacterium]|nr:DUF3471 domain-containing protein [Gemmatimonadota bacterium]